MNNSNIVITMKKLFFLVLSAMFFAASGIPYAQLIDELLRLAVEAAQ